MFKRIVLGGAGALGVAALLALGGAAARWETAGAVTNCTTSTADLDGEELAALQAINALRAASGKGPLLVSPTLNTAAAWKSADSSNTPAFFSHTDSLGRSPYARAIACGYPGGAAENIAYGSSTGAQVVQQWAASAGHLNNMLANYAVIGIGRTGNSWVTNFGLTVDAGAYAVGGNPPPVSNPPPTAPAGGPNPVATEPTSQSGTGAASPLSPSGGIAGPRNPLPPTNHAQWELPSNVPVKRAMMQMVAFE